MKLVERYGPWAVVTGASDGIGRAFATRLAAEGMNVVLVARRAERLQEVQRELEGAHGILAMVVPADLGTPAGLALVDAATATLDVGLLVAAAGYGTSGLLLDADQAAEHDMLAVNCQAALHQSVEFGRRFAARGGGGIVLLSSILSWQGVPRSANYAATKAYVQSLAEGLRIELAASNVDVVSSAPGPVDSGFARRARMRMSRTVSPDTVARVTMRALGRRGTVVPGALSKLLTYALLPLPRSLRSRILGQVMAGMTRHHAAPAARAGFSAT